MATLFHFHQVWGYVAIVLNAIAGVVALIAWRWRSARGKYVWTLTIIAEGALMLQVLVGTILVASKDYVAPRFHMFYGFVSFISIGLLYSYRYVWRAKGWMELAYGLGGLFIMGLGIRAVLQVVAK